jgi:capsular exopolysaccharide synthesis family protein
MAVVDTPQHMADDSAIALANGLLTLQRLSVDEQPRDWLVTGADELFRSLYTRAGIGFTPEVVAISSALAREGKTTVSLGLAVTVAQDYPERRVVVVETDLERRSLADDFAVEATPGLLDYVHGDHAIETVFRPTFLDNLHLVPVGGPVRGSGRALRSSRMADLIEALRQNYDLVVLDTPPLLVNSDAVMLSDLADGSILVVRAGVTPAPSIFKAIEQIEESKLRGVVLNGSKSAVPNWLRRLAGL